VEQRARELAAQLSERDVRYCQVEVPDLDGSLRSKLVAWTRPSPLMASPYAASSSA
jgi:hypothetical protein